MMRSSNVRKLSLSTFRFSEFANHCYSTCLCEHLLSVLFAFLVRFKFVSLNNEYKIEMASLNCFEAVFSTFLKLAISHRKLVYGWSNDLSFSFMAVH